MLAYKAGCMLPSSRSFPSCQRSQSIWWWRRCLEPLGRSACRSFPGLGAYAGDLCIWPGYASNIAFELWQPAKGKHPAAATKPSSVTTTALQKLFPRLLTQATASDKLSYSNSFVRVFFNGEDITQRIPSCAAERVVHSSSSSAGTPSGPILTTPSAASNSSTGNQELLAQAIQDELTLCSLEALVSQVTSLVEPAASISEACTVP